VLTSDLLRVRKRAGMVEPRYLTGAVRVRLLPVVDAIIATLAASVGSPREQLDEALALIEHGATDRPVVQGLIKLLLDRCDFSLPGGVDPLALRHELFPHAAAVRRELEAGQVFDRDAVVAHAAAALGVSPDEVEARMFADLKQNECLRAITPMRSASLLERYDVALAQSVLLRATRVTLALEGEEPGSVRQLFRAARFHGLLHRVERRGDSGWHVELDGPMSLFSANQKYGFKLALFLPAVLRCKRWRLRAELLWGKHKEPMMFELGPDRDLRPYDDRITGVAPAIDDFVSRFEKLECRWSVAHNDEIIALPGEAVCVPDLLFTHQDTGEEVFLEAFGFWSRQAVWQRVETIARGFPSRIILAVGKQLRVSDEVLTEDDAGQIYIYKQNMRPKAVLERLDARG
jgi:hypothetical protein